MQAEPSFTLPLPEWVTVPAGRVLLEALPEIYEIEPFAISKYPVTHAQFEVFIQDGGYGDDCWWQGLAKRFTIPDRAGWPVKNHPRERVNWYEAMAFCYWLSNKLGLTITLPTEMQWQRAAQGDDGRTYPWGNEFDRAKCNTSEGAIKQTMPVNCYPTGGSPYGVIGMSGNVWEWCVNKYTHPGNTDIGGGSPRVLRGGSWHDSQFSARSAFRYYALPDVRLNDVGFRLVGFGPS